MVGHEAGDIIPHMFGKSKIIFDNFHVENPWKGRFVLITDELINNAIEHGSLP